MIGHSLPKMEKKILDLKRQDYNEYSTKVHENKIVSTDNAWRWEMKKKRENQQIRPAYLSSLQPWGPNAAFDRLSLVCTVKSENAIMRKRQCRCGTASAFSLGWKRSINADKAWQWSGGFLALCCAPVPCSTRGHPKRVRRWKTQETRFGGTILYRKEFSAVLIWINKNSKIQIRSFVANFTSSKLALIAVSKIHWQCVLYITTNVST